MKRSVIIALTLSLAGIAVLFAGLTGMVTVDSGNTYCNSDSDCPVACCKFYNSDNGVCDNPSNCDSIKLLSMEQTKSISSTAEERLNSKLPDSITSKIQFENTKVSIWASIIAASLLFLLSMFILMIGNRRGI